MKRHATIGAMAIGLALSSCAGDDEKSTTRPPRPDTVETPSESAPPRSAPGQLPPEFLACMADRGFDISSPDDIHSAPPQVVQACFGSLHGGAP